MHGVTLHSAPSDWEILQQHEGWAEIMMKGVYSVHEAAIDVGVASAVPIFRVVREDDNMSVIPWTPASSVIQEEKFSGSFEVLLRVPEGGLYRIESALETKSTQPNLTWLYRGDCILHVGVGDVFVIAGQSNAAGYSRDFCFDPPHMKVHLYRNRGKWDIASHPMNESTEATSCPNVEMGVPGVSPFLAFGKKYVELTGRPVGLIQTAMGGCKIRSWLPKTGELYENMLDRIRQTKSRPAAVLWYQGCSDTVPEEAGEYRKRFQSCVEGLRKQVGYEIPFFTLQLNRQINGIWDEAWGIVREAQRRAAKEIPKVWILSTTNLSLSDGIHNSAQANLSLGEKLACQCDYVLNGAEEYEAPSLCRTERISEKKKKKLGLAGEWLELTFEYVKKCFLLYSERGEDSGFCIEDRYGRVRIKTIRANREDGNRVYLEMDRALEEDAMISFAWEANPVRWPLVDEVTWLPPLSFYKYKIEERQV